ncbi:MAG: hypothetical protein NTY70_11535 [Burkholderiales bacterium]|nr:hypothetical protein [Burkholderiales bacterium]
MNLKSFFALSLMMLPCLGQAQTAANVCLSKSGEKVFSEATCESREMRTAPADFQVLSAQPVFVVPPSIAAVATLDSARNIPAKVTGEKPSIYGNFKGLAWFIVALKHPSCKPHRYCAVAASCFNFSINPAPALNASLS